MSESTKSKFEVIVTPYGRNKNLDKKKQQDKSWRSIQRIFIDWTKKLDKERTMSELWKPFLKKSDKKETKNQSQNATSEEKTLARKGNLVQTKI